MNSKLLALIAIFITFRICESKNYENFQLVTVVPADIDHLKFLQNLETQKYINLIFWKRPYKLYHEVQFIVNPTDIDLFIERARHFKMNFDVSISNIQRSFDNQTIRRYLRLQVETYSWDHYHTLEDIYQWLSDLTLKFPNVVELYTIGKSVEGREIFALGIGRGSQHSRVIIEGGIHGNEWISVEYVTYLANRLIYSQQSDGRIYNLAMQYKWYLIPVLNPDGYDFTHKVDRLWRKNKRTAGSGVGINLNRNFDYSFGKFEASRDPNDENYCGQAPFSEPETKSLSNFVAQNKDNLKFYFAIHGYGQKIVIPYSDRINHVEDYSELENYGKQAILKMYNLYRRKYAVGTFYDTMGHRISGNSASWVKKTYKLKYALTFFLRDNGTYGYALPLNQILPACEEMLVGMTEIMVAKQRRVRADLFSSAQGVYVNWVIVLLCWAFVAVE